MRYLCKGAALAICMALGALTVLLVLPGLFGIHPLIVQSGSMEPAYPQGSMVYIRGTDPRKLSEGDAVTFRLADGETLVTHRITSIDMEKEEIHTKGDANAREDGAATSFEQIVGIPFFCIPGLGSLAGRLSSMAGKAGILRLVVLVCLLSWMDEVLLRQEGTLEKKRI